MNKKNYFLFYLLLFSFSIIQAQVTCPTDIVEATDANSCGKVIDIDFGVNLADYNVTVISGLLGGETFPIGITYDTIVIEDFLGATDTCIFTVTVNDETAPVFECNDDIVVSTANNSCDAVVFYDTPTINDNCNIGTNVIQQNNSDIISGGSPYSCDTFPVSHIRVFDLAAMGVTGDFIISNIEVGIGFSNTNQSATMKIYSLDGALSYENMTLITEATTTIPNLVNELFKFPISTTVSANTVLVVEYIPTDNRLVGYNTSAGQSAPSYVASPGPACLVTEPTDLETLGETGFALIMKINGGNFTMNQTAGLPSGSTFPLGMTTNTFVATDASGNSSSCSFNVIVEDNQVPIIECPESITTSNDEGGCTAVVDYSIVVNENCPDYNLTQIEGLPSGSAFPNGTTLNTYIATDLAGNADTCSFEVIVTDASPPVFTSCPENITVNVDPDLCGAIVDYTIEATDDCSNPVTLFQKKGLPSGFVFPLGTTFVHHIATDGSGNMADCEFTVTVVGTDDISPSFENCPENIAVNATEDCSAVVEYEMPTITSTCSTFDTELKQNFVDTVAFAYGDCSSNSTKHLRVFNLPSMGIQNQFDINAVAVGVGYVSMPTDITVNLYTLNGALTYANLTSIGTVTQNITPNLNNDTIHIPVVATVPANSTLVAEYVVPDHIDAAHIAGYNYGGQSATSYYAAPQCDVIEPVSLLSMGLNQSLIMEVYGSYSLSSVGFEQIGGLASGSSFPVGTTTNVFAMATDTCSFDVVVTDVDAPLISGCEDVTVNLTGGCNISMEIPVPEISDNCEGWTMENDHTDGIFEVGTTTVTWTATDMSGNSSTCSFDVTVVDTILPSLKCRDMNVAIHGSACDTTFVLSVPDANDNCAIDTTYNNLMNDTFPIGETVVEWTTIDMSGNMATCTSTITVTSDFAPNFDNSTTQDVLCHGDSTGSIALNLDPNFSVNWSNGATTDTITNLIAGTYEVTVVGTECSNGETTHSFEITEPTAIVQDSVVIENETNGGANGSITLYVSGGTAPYTFTNPSGLGAGNYSIDVTDANGCTQTFGPFTVDNMVGNEDLAIFEKVSIQPNPTSAFTIVSFDLAKADLSTIMVYNVTGQEILKKNFSSATHHSIRLDTKSWTKGLYFVHLQSGGFNSVQKLIIE